MSGVALLFWLSISWIVYVWVGYPITILALSLTRRFRCAYANDYCPTVSVLIAARNEQKDIGWKLAQTLAWDYPAGKLEILVGSDASTDGTDEEIRTVRDPRITFLRNPERAGKNVTLNRLARLSSGAILFFTDANTHIGPQCLKAMVRHFADSRVACVTGMESNATSTDASTMAAGNNVYLEYESTVNRLESRIGSVLVCDGSVYCLRRSQFNEVDADLANDLEHPVRAGASGAAILYEPQARSVERCSSPAEEFARRRRIAAQGALAMWRLRQQLRGFRLWQFVSRKFMRWLTVLPLAVALVTNFLLRYQQPYADLLALQMTFYTIALVGLWNQGNSRLSSVLRIPFVFLLAHTAVFLGVLDACRRKTFATWNIAELSRGTSPKRV
jgi:biofilm PGA synthesis N-glycosyltransferase PgaC